MNASEIVKVDDFIEYYVFLLSEKPPADSELQEIYDNLTSFVNQITKNYIWNRGEFTLNRIIPLETDIRCAHLHGILHFGENLEDEWLIVYVMMSFSKRYSNVFIKLYDSDGEFLLIETANVLPKWLQSDSCLYQAYVYNGVVKIVPGEFSTKLNFISNVVDYLIVNCDVSNIEETITRLIEEKVNRYANGLDDFLHKSRVYLPAKIATLLNVKPSLIAAAVTAYCHRDIIDSKICRKMTHFPLENMVLRSVTFTKFLFAMLCHEKELLPKHRFATDHSHSFVPNDKECSLGFKITSGFEILASKCTHISESNLTVNKKWMQYLAVLKRKGYFKDFLQGSKDYTNLENEARNYFLWHTDTIKGDANCVLSILQTVHYDYKSMKLEESLLPVSDDETWMEIDEESFEKFLAERLNCSNFTLTNSPGILSSTLNTFLHSVSDLEGVEVNANDFVRPSSSTLEVENQVRPVSFEAKEFLPSLEKLLHSMSTSDENETSSNNSSTNSEDGSDEENENAPEDIDIKSYMQLMDEELVSANISKNIERISADKNEKTMNFDESVLINISKSYEEQFGGAGPAGNLLHNIGLRLNTKKEQ